MILHFKQNLFQQQQANTVQIANQQVQKLLYNINTKVPLIYDINNCITIMLKTLLQFNWLRKRTAIYPIRQMRAMKNGNSVAIVSVAFTYKFGFSSELG